MDKTRKYTIHIFDADGVASRNLKGGKGVEVSLIFVYSTQIHRIQHYLDQGKRTYTYNNSF